MAREIGRALNGYKVIVTKSTVPVGTSHRVRELIQQELDAAGSDVKFSVASNPEFLREGAAINDFLRPDRVVIGADDDMAAAILRDLYRPLYLNETPFVTTNIPTAELTKYAANAFLATKISFINEVANLCERIGGDVQAVARGIGLDGRIGKKFLHAGAGLRRLVLPEGHALGGALRARARRGVPGRRGHDPGERAPARAHGGEDPQGGRRRSLRQDRSPCSGSRSSPRPTTCATRRRWTSSAGSRRAGRAVRAFDPVAMPAAGRVLRDVAFCEDAYEACEGADALVIVTEWNQFRMLELERVRALLARPVVVDLRNVYEPGPMAKAGFEYHSVGR